MRIQRLRWYLLIHISCPTWMPGWVLLYWASLFVLQNTPVFVMLNVVHPPHSWSSYCPGTSHFHLRRRLLYLIFFIHPHDMPTQARHGCLAFSMIFSTPKYLIFSSLIYLSLSPPVPLSGIFMTAVFSSIVRSAVPRGAKILRGVSIFWYAACSLDILSLLCF